MSDRSVGSACCHPIVSRVRYAYQVLLNLGDAHIEVNKPGQSKICFKHSTWLARKLKDPDLEAQSLWKLCQVHDVLGDGTLALKTANSAVKICESSSDPEAKNLEEEIKKWMIARTERQIEDSNL